MFRMQTQIDLTMSVFLSVGKKSLTDFNSAQIIHSDFGSIGSLKEGHHFEKVVKIKCLKGFFLQYLNISIPNRTVFD